MSNPPAASTSSLIWHFLRTLQIFRSQLIWSGSKLSLNDPSNRNGL
uniref:Uncharacterized protein n=1 Tax=Rhizophora mucronata TaxID=61149 RepID=A0A2P2M4H9_RHIMU